jgi:hypothetical protein
MKLPWSLEHDEGINGYGFEKPSSKKESRITLVQSPLAGLLQNGVMGRRERSRLRAYDAGVGLGCEFQIDLPSRSHGTIWGLAAVKAGYCVALPKLHIG